MRDPLEVKLRAIAQIVFSGLCDCVAGASWPQMTGHKTRSVFERYNIVSEGDLDAAAKRLDEFAVNR